MIGSYDNHKLNTQLTHPVIQSEAKDLPAVAEMLVNQKTIPLQRRSLAFTRDDGDVRR